MPAGKTSIKHLALIPDGNRRFARSRGRPPWEGHFVGSKKMEQFVSWVFEDWNIPVLTVWGLSENNLQRSKPELYVLFRIFEQEFGKLLTDKRTYGKVRVRFIGRRRLLPKKLQAIMADIEEKTAGNRRFILNIAVAYDGQSEIVDAVSAGARTPEDLDRALFPGGMPYPDLIIRTSGEIRTSSFLLWGSSQSEYAFSRKNWPAFTRSDLRRIIEDYGKRNRRFGR